MVKIFRNEIGSKLKLSTNADYNIVSSNEFLNVEQVLEFNSKFIQHFKNETLDLITPPDFILSNNDQTSSTSNFLRIAFIFFKLE